MIADFPGADFDKWKTTPPPSDPFLPCPECSEAETAAAVTEQIKDIIADLCDNRHENTAIWSRVGDQVKELAVDLGDEALTLCRKHGGQSCPKHSEPVEED